MKRDNYMLAIIMSLVGLLFFIMTLQLPKKAKTYPLFILAIMIFLIILLVIQTKMDKSLTNESKMFTDFQKKQFIFIFITAALYVVLMNIVGYYVTTILYVLASLLGLKIKKVKSIFISLGFSAFIYVVFSIMLKVPLPKGFLI